MDLKQNVIYILKIFGISVLILYVAKKINILDIIEITSNLTITDIVAVLGITVFAAGSIFYLGTQLKHKKYYHLKRLEFNFRDQLLIIGGIYVSYILITIFVAFILNDGNKLPIFLMVIIWCVFILSSGYFSAKKFEIVTLKMIGFNEDGSKKVEIRNKLELYAITDKDYWFKDINRNEFIIPNNQVIEIIYSDKTNENEERQ